MPKFSLGVGRVPVVACACAHAPPPRPSAVDFQMSGDGGGTANHEVMPPQT